MISRRNRSPSGRSNNSLPSLTSPLALSPIDSSKRRPESSRNGQLSGSRSNPSCSSRVQTAPVSTRNQTYSNLSDDHDLLSLPTVLLSSSSSSSFISHSRMKSLSNYIPKLLKRNKRSSRMISEHWVDSILTHVQSLQWNIQIVLSS